MVKGIGHPISKNFIPHRKHCGYYMNPYTELSAAVSHAT
jgi:hypothetical protein